ncbi:MAG: hypothetical protein ACM3JD_11550 [Rudaea sp.]
MPEVDLGWVEHLLAESDRGCVLIGQAILDEALGDLLREYFTARSAASTDLLDSLLKSGEYAPLGSFSPRARMARALGIIDEWTFKGLVQLNKTRIPFAHYKQPRAMRLSIEQSERILECVKRSDREVEGERAKLLSDLVNEVQHHFGFTQGTPRFNFVIAVAFLFAELRYRSTSSNHDTTLTA